MSPSPPAVPPASPAAVEMERVLTQVAYLSVRARQHERLVVMAGVPLDRAAVAMLRQIAEHDPCARGARPGAGRPGLPRHPPGAAAAEGRLCHPGRRPR